MEPVNDKYIPKVGDTVRLAGWDRDEWAVVTAVGNRTLLATNRSDSGEFGYLINRDWIKVEPKVPLPERWVTIHIEPDSYVQHLTKRDAYLFDRIAVVHIYTDADGVDHADIERCEPRYPPSTTKETS